MHIVKFQGGLGNQMFQYALYRKFQHLGYDTYADLYPFTEKGYETRDFALPVLGISLREAKKQDIIRLYGDVDSYFDRVWLRTIGKRTYDKERRIAFHPQILAVKEGYFNGYWQSEKYFSDIRDILLKEFCFPRITDPENIRLEKVIKNDKYSVSLHLRMGDYLKVPKMYGGICTAEYYRKAIAYIKERVDEPHFYVFSNDIGAAREMFADEDFVFVGNNSESQGYIDMHLMRLCRHQIIANSSFSWWGAWLNENAEKIVVAPGEWFRKYDVKDIWCEGWKIVEY